MVEAIKIILARVKKNLPALLVGILLGLLLRGFVVSLYIVPTGSMAPTLQIGHHILANKFIYFFKTPERGDIVIFKTPDDPAFMDYQNSNFVKRVVAIPGDTVEVKNSLLYINDKPVKEDYIKEPMKYWMKPVKVPPDNVFVLGDNRNHSLDGHLWDTIWLPTDKIVGKVILKFPF